MLMLTNASRSFKFGLYLVAGVCLIYIATNVASHGFSGSRFDLEQPTTLAPASQSPVTTPKAANAYAIAAFLAAPSWPTKTDDDDVYYVGTRIMIYQLLHDPKTRTNNSYPFVVLVTNDVAPSKISRLEKDGAMVIKVEKMALSWAPTRKAWQDVLTKLHLFELYQYDRVLFLDSDTLILKPMDGIFDDPAVQVQKNLGDRSPEKMPADEGPQPETYVFAGNAGAGFIDHGWPPKKGDNMNSGCMVIRPSKDLYQFYLTIANIPNRFKGQYPEQGLWNYVHRSIGNMPWKPLHYSWNINYATYKDVENGVASVHAKFWQTDHDLKLKELALGIKAKMEAYWADQES